LPQDQSWLAAVWMQHCRSVRHLLRLVGRLQLTPWLGEAPC
jgi:hypothetical protein